jgi:LPS-assembly protein
MRFRIKLVTLSVFYAFSSASCAQDATPAQADAAPLKLDRTFKKAPPGNEAAPVFITARRLEAKAEQQVEATGEVELRSDDQSIAADHLLFMQVSKDLTADGSVRLQQQGATVTGDRLQVNIDSNVGEMTRPEFTFSDTKARGSATTMHMQGKKNFTFEDARYTTCPIGNEDWQVRMSELDLDRNTQIGQAYNARIVFKDVPIFYTPWMDFPLNNQRKSGFMGPLFGGTNKGGSEITVPFYWNIASNMDATLAPRVMDKRGTLYNNEFRYMGQSFMSELHYDDLPYDQLTHQERSRSALVHTQNLGGGVGAAINYTAVSDDAYFRDLSGSLGDAAQKNLLQEGVLTYGSTWWSSSLRVQRYQTLQDPEAPVVVPYQRLPQLNLAAHQVLAGSNLALSAEYVDFSHPTAVNGNRVVLYPTVSYPLISDPAYYVTPKLGVHNTQYTLGVNNPGTQQHFERTLPIFSLDSGMTLEREFNMASTDYVQTVEPRAYYVYVPYENQDMLPNFDTAQAPFSFGQMFMENRFFGNDRIGDANQVTLALTSRLLEADTGSERLRVMLGERFSLETPRVNLVAPTATTNKSDILLGVGGKVTRALSLDGLLQYNPNESRNEMYTFTGRYTPEAGKVFNLGYRMTGDALRQIDMSTQWLLWGRWHAVGRYNYSLLDQRAVEVLAGVEYNQDCWAVRLVGQQFATATQETSTGLFLQLELNELIRVGPDPLDALRLSVPGYTKLNDPPREPAAQGLR